MNKILLCIVLLLPLKGLFAQSDALSLDEIVISESRIQLPFKKQNRNIQVLDQAIISALPVKSVNELLTYVAGLDVRQRGPWGVQSDIGIDGGTFDQTLIMVNGVRVNDPQTGHNTMNLPVPLEAIDRIEVLRGAAARIYGINALNGAVNIVTKKPVSSGFTALAYTGTSFKRDTADQSLFGGNGVQFSGSMVKGNTSHFLAFGNDAASGYRYNTAFNNSKIYYQTSGRISDKSTLDIMAGYIYNDFGANLFYAAPNDKESKETVQTAIGSIGSAIKVNDSWTLKPRFSYRYNKDSYIFIRQQPEYFHNIHKTNVADAEVNNVFNSFYGIFGLGFELRNEHINSNNLGTHNRTNLGISGEYSFNKVGRLLINAGAYVNYNSDYGWEVFPGIDAGFQLNKALRAFANVGTGQRLPTYTDLYYKGPTNIGNDQLKPEHSFSAEGGLKWNTSVLNMMLSGFYRHTSDFIDWIKYDPGDPWQPMNSRSLNTPGLSVSADYRFTFGQISRPWSLLSRLSYTWMSPEIKTDIAQNAISSYAVNSLKNQLTGNLVLDYKRLLSMTVGARYIDRISAASSKYALIDTRFSVTPGAFTIYTDISNLTNREYVEAAAVPMPGRWFSLGVKWSSF